MFRISRAAQKFKIHLGPSPENRSTYDLHPEPDEGAPICHSFYVALRFFLGLQKGVMCPAREADTADRKRIWCYIKVEVERVSQSNI